MKYKAKSIKNWDCSENRGGDWVPARPLNRARFFKRVAYAFGVLCCKYDVLDWEDNA